jgi:hypothetical protein
MENLRKYSTVEIIPITLASADKTLDGYYYSKAVGPVRSVRDKGSQHEAGRSD